MPPTRLTVPARAHSLARRGIGAREPPIQLEHARAAAEAFEGMPIAGRGPVPSDAQELPRRQVEEHGARALHFLDPLHPRARLDLAAERPQVRDECFGDALGSPTGAPATSQSGSGPSRARAPSLRTRRSSAPTGARAVTTPRGSARRCGTAFPWSNGRVEGQVNRFELVERTTYEGASFDPLRRRVLAAEHRRITRDPVLHHRHQDPRRTNLIPPQTPIRALRAAGDPW
jgi:hypothetical protein